MKNRTNFRKNSSFCLCLKAKTANPDTNAHVLSARPDDAVVVISNLFSLMNFNKNEEVVNLKSKKGPDTIRSLSVGHQDYRELQSCSKIID